MTASLVNGERTMVCRGRVEKGVVVLDDPAALPEGAVVRVEPIAAETGEPLLDENGLTLGQKLLKHAGKAVGLPPDLAMNHDHYLYGTSKK
jgi:hypothetical protein